MKIYVTALILFFGACTQSSPDVVGKNLDFDKHTGASNSNGSPSVGYAEGDTGVLRYAGRCLYIERRNAKIGLILPKNSKFDGVDLSYRNEVRKIGKQYTFQGLITERAKYGQTVKCDTDFILEVTP